MFVVGTSFSTFHVGQSCEEYTCFSWSFSCLVNSARFPSTVYNLLDYAETLCLVNLREHLNGPDHPCNCVFCLLRVSQSVSGTIQRRLACPCAGVNTHQSRSVVKFCVAQFLRILCLFPFSSQGRDFILHCCSQLRTCLVEC